MKILILILIASFSFVSTGLAATGDKPANVRLFGSVNSFDNTDINNYLKAEGLEELDSTIGGGGEFLYPAFWNVSVGFRASARWGSSKETAATSARPEDPYMANIRQSYLAGVVRVDIVRTSNFLVDVYGLVGSAQTRMDISTPSGAGDFKKGKAGMGSLMTGYGASVGVGGAGVLFYVEAGMENLEPEKLTRTGTLPDVYKLDLSGPVVLAGFVFDGLPKFIKRK